MKVSKEEVVKISKLAKLKFADNELDKFVDDFNKILEYVEKLNELNDDSAEPLTHPIAIENIYRDDRALDSIDLHDALKNAPNCDEQYFLTPKAIE